MFSSTSRSSCHAFLISAAVSLLVGGLGRTAAATECTTDSDCSSGYQCVPGKGVAGTAAAGGATSIGAGAATGSVGGGMLAPVGGATSIGAGATTGSASDGTSGAGGRVGTSGAGAAIAGTCPVGSKCATTAPLPPPVPMPIVTGICQPKQPEPIVCTGVADCPSADFDCVPDLVAKPVAACPPDTKCEAPPLETSNTGTCVAKKHACSTVADCPAPLACQAQFSECTGGAMIGPGGVVTETSSTCTPGPLVCTWAPVTCNADSDCADFYQCVKVSESGFCSGSAPVACAKGETCPTPETANCGTTVVKNCMPRPMNCDCGPCPAGAMCGQCLTCPAGWSCFDFSAYNGGVRPTWSADAPDKSCLPDGIVLWTQGHASDSGQFGASGTSGSGDVGLATGPKGNGVASGDTSTSGRPSSAPPSLVSPVPPSQGGATGNVGGEASAAAHSSGCAYGGGTSQRALWLGLAMTGLVARLARRRNRAR